MELEAWKVKQTLVREANAPFAQVCKYLYSYSTNASLSCRHMPARETPYFAVLASVVSCQFFGTASSLSFMLSWIPCCRFTCSPAATARSVLA